jgi:hypothetical protein
MIVIRVVFNFFLRSRTLRSQSHRRGYRGKLGRNVPIFSLIDVEPHYQMSVPILKPPGAEGSRFAPRDQLMRARAFLGGY